MSMSTTSTSPPIPLEMQHTIWPSWVIPVEREKTEASLLRTLYSEGCPVVHYEKTMADGNFGKAHLAHPEQFVSSDEYIIKAVRLNNPEVMARNKKKGKIFSSLVSVVSEVEHLRKQPGNEESKLYVMHDRNGIPEKGFIFMKKFEAVASDVFKGPHHDDAVEKSSELQTLVTQIEAQIHANEEQGLSHSDEHPGNMVRTKDGTWHLSDWGCASDLQGSNRATAAGDVLQYNQRYFSPETRFLGSLPCGEKNGLLRLGASALELLLGKRPEFMMKNYDPSDMPTDRDSYSRSVEKVKIYGMEVDRELKQLFQNPPSGSLLACLNSQEKKNWETKIRGLLQI